jgi:hypothetical protein
MSFEMVVPAVLVLRITHQYSHGRKRRARNCAYSDTRNTPSSRALLSA